MANSYFQFKQFRVEQECCAMKVCTDACIQGAYTSVPKAQRILDIGTGTGLLSLMLAQRHPSAEIDAVEIEPDAFAQATANVANSPWSSRIQPHHLPVQSFIPDAPYDLIISNPPFYPEHLLSLDAQRNEALHQASLNFRELAKICKKHLRHDGLCSILLPPRQMQEFCKEALQEGLYLQHELRIQDTHTHPVLRNISFFKQEAQKSPSCDRLVIRNEDRTYSQEFRLLLQPYYTIF